jgi:hypothetical protein
MNSTVKNVIVFTVGAAIGSIVTWKLLKTTYEQIAREEIDSVKEAFSKRENHLMTELDEAHEHMRENEEKDEAAVTDIRAHMPTHEYVDYTKISQDKKKEAESVSDKPYVIPPEEFGSREDYMEISLTYYADGMLADEDDDLVEDVEGTVGFESLTHFGEFEDDSVYVRNESRKADYEILKDERKYTDVKNRH